MEEEADGVADRLLDEGAGAGVVIEAGVGSVLLLRDSDVVVVVVDDDWLGSVVVEGVVAVGDVVAVDREGEGDEDGDDSTAARIVGNWLTAADADSDGPASWPSPVRRPLPALMVRLKLWYRRSNCSSCSLKLCSGDVGAIG